MWICKSPQTKTQCSPFVRHNSLPVQQLAPLETCGSECGEGGQWTLLGSTIDPTTTYTRYTPALYTSCTSLAQPTPPSPDTTTFYTRYTTVVQPTPDMPTLCTIYTRTTRHAKCPPQNPHQENPRFTTYVVDQTRKLHSSLDMYNRQYSPAIYH